VEINGDSLLVGATRGIVSSGMRAWEARWSDATVRTIGTVAPSQMAARGGEVIFDAPQSGQVRIDFGGQSKSGAVGQYVAIGIEVKTGATLGSGTVVRTYDVNESWLNYSTDYQVGMISLIQEGLTPGATYNIRNLCASGTTTVGSVLRGRIVVTPVF